MVTGHSFLPADRDFSLIERKIRKSTIQVPDDLKNCIISARVHPEPFQLRVMNGEDFKNLELLSNVTPLPRGFRITNQMAIKIKRNSAERFFVKCIYNIYVFSSYFYEVF